MRRTLFVSATLLALLAFLPSCSSSDTEPGGSGSPGSTGSGGNGGEAAQSSSTGSPTGSGGAGGQGGGAQGGGGGSGGASAALLLKEDFESSTEGQLPDPTVWSSAITSNGTIQVTTARAHGGQKSMHIVSPSDSYETFVKTSVPFPVKNNIFWGRLWFYVKSNMPSDFVHWTVMEARGVETNNRVRYGGINNANDNGFVGNWFLFNVETQGKGEIGIDDKIDPVVPDSEWICMEWLYSGQPGKNEARLFWNGEEREKLHAMPDFFTGDYAMPTFDRLYIGWAIYQPIDMPYEVWIDDIAVSEERIFCQ